MRNKITQTLMENRKSLLKFSKTADEFTTFRETNKRRVDIPIHRRCESDGEACEEAELLAH